MECCDDLCGNATKWKFVVKVGRDVEDFKKGCGYGTLSGFGNADKGKCEIVQVGAIDHGFKKGRGFGAFGVEVVV